MRHSLGPMVIFRNILCAFLLAGWVMTPVTSAAQTVDEGTLRVGVWEVPPFAIKGEQGWHGIAFELWEEAARDLRLPYEIIEFSHHDLLVALDKGEIDVAISDMSITHNNHKRFDFSRAFYHSALSIAEKTEPVSTVERVIRALLSPGVLWVIAVLLGLVMLGAVIFWIIEKDKNALLYDPEHKRLNFSNGILWGILLITAQEPDIFKNTSIWGRFVAIFLLFIGITVSASYIALITSHLTVSKLTYDVHSVADLPSLKIATVTETRAEEYLQAHHLRYRRFENLDEAMAELEAETVDVVVADEAELVYFRRQFTEEPISILAVHLETEYYALGFPKGSTLPDRIDPVISRIVEGPAWENVLVRYLGASEAHAH